MRSRNFRASLVGGIAPGTANTEMTIAHGLDAQPRGYFITRRNAAASVYLGTTAWDSTTAYLKSDTANAAFSVLFFV